VTWPMVPLSPDPSSLGSGGSTLPSMLPSALALLGCASLPDRPDECSPDTGPTSPWWATSASSTPAHHESSSSTAATPASRSPLPALDEAPSTNGTSGPRWLDSFAFYDRTSSCWRTSQRTFISDGDEPSPTWPPWGMTFAGECFELPTPEPLTSDDDCLLLPTPTAGDAKQSGSRNLPGSKANAGVSLSDTFRTGGSTTPRSSDPGPAPSRAGKESPASPHPGQLTIGDV